MASTRVLRICTDVFSGYVQDIRIETQGQDMNAVERAIVDGVRHLLVKTQ